MMLPFCLALANIYYRISEHVFHDLTCLEGSATDYSFCLALANISYIRWGEQKGADQTARMRRLICTFFVRIICHDLTRLKVSVY